jgi:sulfate transport system ATP-binding protein
VVVLNHGKIEQVGTPDEVYDRPASPFVAGFIGETNALPVTVKAGTIFLDDQPIGSAPADSGEGPRTLAFRPHDVAFLEGEALGISGTVVSELRHGSTRRLAVEVGVKRHRIEVDVAAEMASKKGGRVVIVPRAFRLFPRGALDG